ncbi:PREDICTED: la-related protein 1C-like isoform X2 [Camelina sativa]|uniref:La-related protein 1C-like isoform X1 n=1 Tax=Camelina sativa TaxID=90675 RepID=A0ABM0TVU6_CAMSA|nr:PREDICTED: la-related protein 1C-like isoform X1 [Camelina sativa]XP_019086582.1 PREDICTED: la-related protein 1C-like isoform X2 [Camelina sativa]
MASATSNNSASSSSMSPRRMTENHGNPNAAAVSQSPRRPSRQVSSPWSHVVRGESDPIATAAAVVAAPSSHQSKAPIEPVASVSVSAPPDSVLTVDDKSEESAVVGQGNAGKKPVWKRPSNGSSSEVGPVMGASSWPALSEATTKAPSNKSSSDSLKSLGDVPSSSPSSSSVPVSQGIANASVPAARANPGPTPNHSRQRSFKRNGASGSANGTVSQPSAHGSFAELPSHNPSPRGQNQRNGFASQTHGSADNLPQRDSFRNQNGNHHQSHGGRRNQEHGNQNWAYHRSFNGREGNAQSQRPAFVRHAPPPVQPIPPHFMAAQPIQPFASPVPFSPEMASSYYPRMPFMTPLAPGPVFYHVQDPPLHIKLQNQIQYYFSEENLVTDLYLRGFMDEDGFVPLRVIAGFKKVAELTDSIQHIVEALQNSPVVEVQGDVIRKRHEWHQWVLQNMRTPAVSSPQAVDRADAVASRLGNLALDQSSADPTGGSSSQLQQPREALSDVQQQSSGVVPVSNHNDSDGANR